VRIRIILGISLFCVGLYAGSGMSPQTAEVVTKEAAVTFKSTSNLVPVTVVVRDSKGHAAGSLGREDFQLFDNGKPQVISKFTVERISNDEGAQAPAPNSPKPARSETLVNATTAGIPDRFVAYLFDDLHLSYADLNYTRDAARRQIDSSVHPLERVAIYTTSGRYMTDFTGDREKLHKALDLLNAGQAAASTEMQVRACPPVTYFMGDLIYNSNNAGATAIALADAAACAPGMTGPVLTQMVQNAARDAVSLGDRETLWALDALGTVVGKMASMPGQRSIVLVSPGFLVLSDRLPEETALIERAIRTNVVIGALDARGLYTMIPGGDASTRGNPSPALISAKNTYRTSETLAQSDIMDELSSATGGKFYKGNNDMDAGLTLIAALPEYVYVLGFTPRDLKLDGRYHSLKVSLKSVKGMDLQVRKGYYAARYSPDPKDQGRQQLEETFFSRDEIHDLPAQLQTQYFKLDNGDATLSAVANVDVKKLTFHKEADRNRNALTVETGLFDNDGNFITGVEKIVTLSLLDETLEKRLGSGIGVKSSFTVHPGRYVVRMVVRDSEGQLMSAQSSLVEVP
jgi:VWFA-related protein